MDMNFFERVWNSILTWLTSLVDNSHVIVMKLITIILILLVSKLIIVIITRIVKKITVKRQQKTDNITAINRAQTLYTLFRSSIKWIV